MLDFSLSNRPTTLSLAAVLVALSLLMATKMGTEFLPTLDERDIALHALRVTGTNLSQSVSMQDVLESKIKELPEVDFVFTKLGTADVATDPMPPSVSDVFVIIKQRSEWPDPALEKAVLIEALAAKLTEIPGNKYEITQPIEMRFNELIAGVRSDVAVKVFGDELDTLVSSAQEIEHALATVPGAADVRTEQVTGLPILTLEMDRVEMARMGLNVADVQDAIEIAIGGKVAGQVFEGDRRFDLIVRLPDRMRQDVERLKNMPLPLPSRHQHAGVKGVSKIKIKKESNYIPLGSVARFKLVKSPNQISRENGKRRVVVTANVRGRDLGAFVENAQTVIRQKVSLPAGYWISWGGQFENMISAAKRLWVVVPLTLVLIFLLLFSAFDSMKNALLVFTGVPLALTGGVLALWVRGIPLSISAAVGFIALSGVAVLNGIVMISFITKLRSEGKTLDDAIRLGSLTRLRPVLMTALVASFGFIPMALATGTGAEVQRPLATVVVGGILSSTALTLLVLPALYRTFYKVK